MATDFVQKMANSQFSLLWHSETVWDIATSMGALTADMMLAMRDNSTYDACISCESSVKFGSVTPELTGLICERIV